MSKVRLFGFVLLALSGLLIVSAQAASTRTRLLSSDNPSAVGQWIALTAEVDALGVRAAPQGQVTFGDGVTPLGVAVLGAVGAGQATIALGGSHSCALTSLGGVQCWGWNADGQLGDRTTEDRSQAVDVVGLNRGAVAVAAGLRHSCALTRAGGVKCWGANLSGQLGDGTFISRLEPVDVVGLTRGVVAISLGANHSCALTAAGAVKCWGWGRLGQLGDGTIAGKKSTPVMVTGLSRGVVGIAAGANHNCAVMSAGGAKCWGDNEYGQLGDGTTTMRLAPVNVFGLSAGVVSMSGATRHSCALINIGGVKCWGMNSFGQLGDGSLLDRLTPVDVIGLRTDVAAISVRGLHSCVIKTTGGAMCWGAGALGVRSTSRSPTPVNVAGLSSGVTAIASGYRHSCALLGDGVLACWGSNAKGQLGDGGFRLRGFVSIKAGALHNCGLTPAGGVKCWGWNDSGQLGDGTKVDRAVPVDVAGLSSGVVSLASAERNTCALTAAGAVKCWGWNNYGQIGDGTRTDRLTPVDVVGLSSGVTAIGAARGAHFCALTDAGQVMCWGRNTYGEIGDGTRADRSTPVRVVGLPNRVVALATGDVHSCVIMDIGGVNCWGLNNHLQLGDGTGVFLRTSPTQVAGLTSGVTLLRTGWASNCVSVGGLKCWGLNAEGELGDGTKINRSFPVDVVGLSSGVQTLEFGYGHACAIRLDGELVCWGQNDTGQVGDGTSVHRSKPVIVTALSRKASALALGWYHTCVIDVAGDVACWGDNSHGQLGLGGASFREPSSVTGFRGLMRARAQLITRSLTSGDHVLTAAFAGDATLAGSSATLVQKVQ